MSTDLQTIHSSKLVPVARGLALKVLEDPTVRAGLAAAESLAGIVVTNEVEQASVADLVGQVASSRKRLEAGAAKVLELPKAMVAAVREAVAPDKERLERGEKAGKDAIGRYLAEKRRAAEAEAQRRREETETAAELHEAQVTVDPEAPPPMAEAPAPEFKGQARGGSTMLHETKILRCALVDAAECPPDWLRLYEPAAKEAFREVLRRGGTLPEPGDESRPVRWCGVDFWYERTLSARSDFRR